MSLLNIDTWAIAVAELEIALEEQVEAIAPTCSECKHFRGDGMFTGVCLQHEIRVLPYDKTCSFHQ